MKKVVLVLLMMVTIVTQVWAAEKDISAREAKSLLEKNKNIYLLDVRTPRNTAREAGRVRADPDWRV